EDVRSLSRRGEQDAASVSGDLEDRRRYQRVPRDLAAHGGCQDSIREARRRDQGGAGDGQGPRELPGGLSRRERDLRFLPRAIPRQEKLRACAWPARIRGRMNRAGTSAAPIAGRLAQPDSPAILRNRRRNESLIGATTAMKLPKFLHGIGVRQVRLACGFVLFSYLLSHFVNHSLGNISLPAMEYGLWFHMTWWQSPIGTLLLYPALAVHASLGLWALYQRRHFRWKAIELVQLIFGLSIPALLCTHLVGQRLGVTLYGLQRSYAQTLYNLWVARPDFAVMQVTVLLVAWIHGCIGLYLWLRMKRFFPRVAPVLLGGAVLLPVLALLGFYQQGRNVAQLAQQPEWRAEVVTPARRGTAAQR